jgi:16S rRNA (uracil1498-N3)-methyltransferase
MHRFFVAPEQIAGERVRFRDDQARQIRGVLRLRPGDRITVLDNTGDACRVRLEHVSREQTDGIIETRSAAETEPSARLTLYQSLLKREKFEWVLQKGTELGVARFAPVVTRRSLVRAAESDKLDRWRRIIAEAAEQSGRARLPELLTPVTLEEALRYTGGYAKSILAWEGPGRRGLTAALAGLPPAPAVAVFIGPEGGYDDDEIETAREAGVAVVTLGPRILRTETAAVVAVALTLHALGEMGEPRCLNP